MQVISPHFSVLDALFLMPKIHAVVKSVMGGKIKTPPSEHLHAGYQYPFGDEENAENLELLQTWPTNSEISQELIIANKIANSLAHLAGMGPLPEDNDLDIENESEELQAPIEDDNPGTYIGSQYTPFKLFTSFRIINFIQMYWYVHQRIIK
jgi:hypothetical protein